MGKRVVVYFSSVLQIYNDFSIGIERFFVISGIKNMTEIAVLLLFIYGTVVFMWLLFVCIVFW